jgi:hypothetical protein
MMVLLRVLAFFGVLALLAGCFRAALRLLRGGVESYVAGAVATARAGRGDLSGLSAAEQWRKDSRAAKRWYTAHALGWVGLLIVPSLTPWSTEIYAACALLWLRPRRWRLRPQPADPSEALYGRVSPGDIVHPHRGAESRGRSIDGVRQTPRQPPEQ